MAWLHESLRFLSRGDVKEQRKLKWITTLRLESLERRVHPSATPELAGFVAAQFGSDTNTAQLLQVAAPVVQQQILTQEAVPGAGDFRAIAAAPSGSIVFSGEPVGMTDGIYSLGTTPGAFTLLSSKPADGLALDGQGDVIAMRFGIKNGESDPSQVTISSIAPGSGDVETVLYQDAGTGGKYEAVAADQQGHVYFAGQPGAAAADGIYQIDKATNSATLVKAGHADELAADSEGDLLAMQFGHDTYGNHAGGAAISQIAPASGSETAVYSDTASGDYYQDLTVDASGQVLFSGQPGAGMTNGIYRLNATSGALDLLSRQPADQIAITGNNLLALRIGQLSGELGQFNEISVQTPIETVLLHDSSAAAGVQQAIAVGPDGSLAVSGNPAPGLGDGIYLRAAGSSSFQQISAMPADALAIDPQGNVVAMRLGRDASGDPLGVTISSIPASGGDHETLLYQDAGGVYEAVAVDQQGNVYFAGQPSAAGSVDGLYKVTSTTSATLIKAGHADQLAVDGEGDLLAMQFGHDSYGHHAGGATISSVAPASGAQTVLYNDTAAGDMYNSLAVAANGQVLIAGQPGADLSDGIYRLNAAAGTLDLVSASHADRIGTDAQGDIVVLRLGRGLGAGGTAAQLAEIAPQAPLATVALRNLLASAGTLQDVAVGPDGRTVISGAPAPGLQAGIYQLGATPGSFKLISDQTADELAVDSEGDIFAMRFGHDSYGHVAGGAAITEYSASGGASAVVYSDTSTADQYQDLAIDQQGNVYVAGRPGAAAADGIYKLNGPSTAPTLVAKGHVDRLAIDAEGDILAMTFGHDAYGNSSGGAAISEMSGGGGGASSVIYNEPAPGGFFTDMAVRPNGQVLFSGQPGPAATDGVYALNPSTGEVDLLLAAHVDRLASMTVGVVAEGGYTLSATPGNSSTQQTLATFTDPLGPLPTDQYSAHVSWGDQTNSAGDVQLNSASGVFSVSGSHAYANAGNFTVTVSITRADSAPTTVSSAAMIAPLTSVPQSGPDVIGVQGNSVVKFSDQLAAEAPNETVLFNGQAGDSDNTALALAPDGSTVFSALAPVGGSPGIYRLSTNGSVQLVSDQPADSLAVDNQGDVLALRFGAALTAVGDSSVLSQAFYNDAGGTDVGWVGAIYPIFGGGAATGPDTAYLTNLLAQGYTRASIVESFAASAQFYDYAGGNAKAWVDATFSAVLGRTATTSDESYWTGKLTQGQSRLQVVEEMLTVDTATLSSIAPGAGDLETVLFQDSGGAYQDLAIDPQGNVYLAGQPSASGSTDGVYKLTKSGALTLVATGHADKLAIDAEGDILAMRFSHDAYGNQSGGATVSEIAAGAGAAATPAVVYNDPSTSDYYSGVAAGPNGQILLSGNEGSISGIFRLNTTTGTLDLLSRADGAFAVDALGNIVATSDLGSGAVLLKSTPHSPIETVLLPNSLGGYQDAVPAPDGSVVVSGQPVGTSSSGIYRIGTTAGTPTQISDTPADELAVDNEGDIFAMRFAHDAYGHAGAASITEYSASGGAATVVYNDASTADVYEDLAVDQHGNVYLAGQPGATAADGVYKLNGAGNAPTLLAAGHADRLAIDAEGDILAMQFGHDAYGQSAGGGIAQISSGGASTPIYSDTNAGDFYNDLAVNAAGQILLSGQPGPGAVNGVYTLDPHTGQLALVNPFATNRIAATPSLSVAAVGGLSLSADVGVATGEQTLATFTDPAGAGALGDYSATVDWDDQSPTSTATITFDTATNTFAVLDAHTYLSVGDFAISVTIHRAGSPDTTVADQAGVSLPSTGGASLTATEGVLVSSSSLATFSDPIAGNYTAVIDWGDGQISTGTVTSTDGTHTVSGSNSYSLAGTETITITLTDPNGNTASAHSTAVVADVPLVISTLPVSATAGTVASIPLATFTDPGGALPLSHYSATINWGDQTGGSAAIISGPNADGVFTISGSHAYSGPGAPAISVAVHHDLAPDVTVNVAATVVGAVNYSSPGGDVTVKAVGGNLQILAGTTLASSTPLADVLAVTVNGLTGTDNNFTLDYSGGTFIVPDGITFNGGALPDTKNNILTVVGGSFDIETFRFSTAHNGSIQLGTNGQLVNYTNMTPLESTGTADKTVFILPDGTVLATLDAGQTPGTVQLASGNGSFETTTFPVPSQSLTVNAGTGTATVTPTVAFNEIFTGNLSVQGAANTLSVRATAAGALAATGGAPLSGTVATFSDPNGAGAAGDYSATIDWGDGSLPSTAAISAPDSNGVFTVSGSHTYADESATAKTLSVTVHRAGAADVTVADTVSVSPAPTLATGQTVSGTAATAISTTVAQFTHGDGSLPTGDFNATIDWGDGTVSTGSVTEAGGSYSVAGTHTYAQAGTFTVATTISEGGVATVADGSAVVAPTINLLGNFGLVEDVYVIGSGKVTVSATNGVLANDSGPNQLVVTSGTVAGGEGGTFVFNADGSFTYTPPTNSPGFDYAKYTATDAQGDQASATVSVLSQLPGEKIVAGGVIWKFFEQVLDRDPAPSDLKFFIPQLATNSPGLLAVDFFESDELLNQIITGFYLQYLGRAPQGNDLQFWKDKWREYGGSETIKAQFASSVEFNNLAIKQYGDYPDGWLKALYNRVLNRPPLPGDLPFWETQLAGGLTEGQVALDFFASREGFGDDVTGWFNEYLQRPPTSTELAQYVNQLLGGSSDRTIEQEITSLDEYGANPPDSPAGTAVPLPDYFPKSSATKTAAVRAANALFAELGES